MTHHPFLKGVGLGMIAGAAVGVTMMKHQRCIKRKARKTAHCMEHMMDNVTDAFVRKLH